MKKRLLAVLAIAVLTVNSAVTAFAQPSPEVTSPIQLLSVLDDDGKVLGEDVKILIDELEDNELAMANEVIKEGNLKTVLGDRYLEGLQAIAMVDVYPAMADTNEEITWTKFTELTDSEYISVTFKVPGVTAKSEVRVLHHYDNWHEEQLITVGEGTVTVKFKHLSPVVFLVNNPDAEDTDGSSSSGGSDSDVPKTGDNNQLFLYGVLAVVAVGVVAVVVARKKLNK